MSITERQKMANIIVDIDTYITQYPQELQEKLQILRETILAAAPNAIEKMSYQMPTFYLNGNLAHFAVYKNHIGFYPAPSAINFFLQALTMYKTSKGAIQFPISASLPLALLSKIVSYCKTENETKTK